MGGPFAELTAGVSVAAFRPWVAPARPAGAAFAGPVLAARAAAQITAPAGGGAPGYDDHMTSPRRLVSSGSPLEPEIGFSRAVRSGPYVCVAGTAPIAAGGGVAARGDVYGQAVRCLDIAEQALREAGASLADVVRTRVMLTDITQWQEAARAHAQRFAQVRPACTFVGVSRFVDPEWLVEFELDAIIPDPPGP
jgi:enamine deaminase RidA (YjgF/YER057c/UK114 family)